MGPVAENSMLINNEPINEMMEREMKAKWMCAVALSLQAWSGMSCAAGLISTASMEVSLRIVESCAVRVAVNGADGTAQVSCEHGAPFLVSQHAAAPATPPAPAPVTEQHAATATAPAVLTVAF
jgi:hypothetical protein